MNIKDECIHAYKKILDILEEDSRNISAGLDGKILVAYRKLVQKEQDIITSALQSIYDTY